MYFLAQELVAAGKRVDIVVGAETIERVLKPIEAKRLSQTVAIVTADGTLGDRGGVLDVLPEAADRCAAQVIYAAASARERKAMSSSRVLRARTTRISSPSWEEILLARSTLAAVTPPT